MSASERPGNAPMRLSATSRAENRVLGQPHRARAAASDLADEPVPVGDRGHPVKARHWLPGASHPSGSEGRPALVRRVTRG